jgi:hypothetical protein
LLEGVVDRIDRLFGIAEQHRDLRVFITPVFDAAKPDFIERLSTIMFSALSTSRIGMP